MKILLTLFLFIILLNFSSQKKEYYFLNITTYNHAERVYKGTFIYQISDNILSVMNSKQSRFRDDVLFYKKIDQKSINKLKKLNLNDLENNYFNRCILSSSGSEYIINLEDEKYEKEILVHHFYNPKIDELITELNKHIPQKLKLEYVSSATKQDCK